MNDALDQMIDALGLEVAAIRKRGGGTQLELRGGERMGQTGGSWLYCFPVMEDLHLRDDTPVRLKLPDSEVNGVLVSFRDGMLVVAVESDLGPRIAFARLLADDSFLIERLKQRLEQIRSGEAECNRAAGERVLGQKRPRCGDADPGAVLLGSDHLNDDQRAAIRRSLASDTTFVWGPPGTGKTTTLARIVEAHYRAGRSVLLVSNTNIAVDTALEKVAECLEGESEFHQGAVLRQGPVVKEELRQRFGSQVILDEVVARLGESLQKEKTELQAEARRLEQEGRALEQALADHEALEAHRQEVKDLETAIETARQSARAREREAEGHETRANVLRAKLERARTMGTVRRFLSGLNPERLEREVAAAERAAQAARDATQALTAQVRSRELKLGPLRTAVERLAQTVRAYPPATECRSRLEPIRTRLEGIRQRIRALDQRLAALVDEVIARCRILATTVYRTYLGTGLRRNFDVVVVDEASMLMPPLVYYAAGLSAQSVTVAGDFRQLPPIVMSEAPLAREWLKRDVFEMAGIPSQLRSGQPTPQLVALRTQYRMHEPICEVINRFFYNDHPLHTAPSVARETSAFPLTAAPLLYVDTSPYNPWTALRVGTYSRYNLFHALLLRNLVLHLAERGYLPHGEQPNNAVGVVAPYAAQARLVQALLEDRLDRRAAGIAATVHRFQGNEKKAMLIDLTDSLGTPLGRFLKAVHIEEDGARLLNVAASRARHHVVLVANFDYLRAKAPHDAIVRCLLEHFQEHGEALDVETLLPLADRDWVDGLHQVLPAVFELPDGAAGSFTEGTFYPAFLKDLARVRESLVLFSPFATVIGTSRWVEPLRAAMARGVAVRVVTRPPKDAGGSPAEEMAEIIRGLRQLGVIVDLRARMHEKFAILDNRVLWHGSLNILSHRDTSESMLRIESPAACEQIGRFVSTPVGQEEAPALHAATNPKCPMCKGPTVWKSGRYGIYFECENVACDGKVDAQRPGRRRARTAGKRTGSRARKRPQAANGKGGAGQPCPQPGCDGRLIQRNGRYGAFFGCTNYPQCRYTEDVG
jgi:ssDNA-binding Zn-finger/Zn-ribbon topoisomerase 1